MERWKMKEYTLEELAEYNGKNGKMYVAYQGQVYDVSDSYLWEGGTRDFMMQEKTLLKRWTRHLMGLKYLRTILLLGL
jgi:hypothetical protein